MSELKPYPKYKDSGVEWIGEIPENWDKVALSRIITVSSGKSVSTNKIHRKPTSEFIYPVIGGNGLMGYTDSVNIQNSTISIGRVGALCGNVHLINYKSWITDNSLYITNYNKNQVDLEYLTNVLRMVNLNEYSTSTAQPLITGETVKRREIPFPKLELQQQISLYVKSKISEIDSLIADKEKLIELLEEKRQAVITETVTKGLDPTVKMKDSGIEWIGDIPDHWGVSKVKYHTILNRETLSESTNPDKKIKYIDIGSVDSQGNIKNIETLNYRSSPSRARRVVENGDTIVSTVRTYLQAITMIDENTAGHIVSTGFAVLTPLKSVVNEYLGLYFRSRPVLDRIVSISKGISYPAVNSSDLIQLEFIYPPYVEQVEIIKVIKRKLEDIEVITKKINPQISKLKEYRESLIYEAVTGKIDLRDYESEME